MRFFLLAFMIASSQLLATGLKDLDVVGGILEANIEKDRSSSAGFLVAHCLNRDENKNCTKTQIAECLSENYCRFSTYSMVFELTDNFQKKYHKHFKRQARRMGYPIGFFTLFDLALIGLYQQDGNSEKNVLKGILLLPYALAIDTITLPYSLYDRLYLYKKRKNLIIQSFQYLVDQKNIGNTKKVSPNNYRYLMYAYDRFHR